MTERYDRLPSTRIWNMIFFERMALAADLARIAPEAWETPSLCEGLTVREVLAHLTAGASLDLRQWMRGVIECRFDFDAQVHLQLRRHLGATWEETLEGFDRVDGSTTKAIPLKALLGETVVHGEDIRRPLGIRHDYAVATVTALAEYYRRSNFVVVAGKRAKGLRLEASDGPFAAGAGPLVQGRTIALIMAMTGRDAYCDELEGDGVPILRERCESM